MSLTGFLSYSRVNWQQSPSKSTPLSAANLNVMDAGIKNNNDMISNLRDEVTQLNSNNINIPINVDTNTFTITEYFRYSTYGKICIIDFGGIISNKSGRSILLSNEIPKPITRTVCVLTDADAPITQSPIIAVSYNKINTKELRIHIRNDAVKKALYGQMFYFI